MTWEQLAEKIVDMSPEQRKERVWGVLSISSYPYEFTDVSFAGKNDKDLDENQPYLT